MPSATVTTYLYVPDSDYLMLRAFADNPGISLDIRYWREHVFPDISEDGIIGMFWELRRMGLITDIPVKLTDAGKEFLRQTLSNNT